MTENEIKNTKEWFEYFIKTYALSNQETIEFQKAVACLEEILQYRAIGTVEGYERAIQSSVENYNLYREYKAKVQEFEEIGTIEEFEALKEKAEPKKPLLREEKYPQNYGIYSTADRWCPYCKGLIFSNDWSIEKQKIMYKRIICGCGQKLDWS